MATVDLADRGTRVLKRKHKNIDLDSRDYRLLCEHLFTAFKAGMNFDPEVILSDSSKYRSGMVPVYEFLAKYAKIDFDKEFDQQLMSQLEIDETSPANGIISLSFNYYSALKNTKHRLTFHAPHAPITKTWPQSLIQHGAPSVVMDKFATV